MPKINILVYGCLLIVMLIASITPASATPGSLNSISKERVGSLKEIHSQTQEIKRAAVGSLKSLTEDKKEQKQALTAALWVQRSKAHAVNLNAKYSRHYTILNNLITRYEKRLNSMKAEKKNVETAQLKLTQAKEVLADTKLLTQQAVAKFNGFTAADFSNRKTLTKEASNLANQARDQFKQVIRLLRDSVLALKETNGDVDTAKITASPSPSPVNQ